MSGLWPAINKLVIKTTLAFGAFVGAALFTLDPGANRVRHAVASPSPVRSRISWRYAGFTAVAGSAIMIGSVRPVGVVVWPLPP